MIYIDIPHRASGTAVFFNEDCRAQCRDAVAMDPLKERGNVDPVVPHKTRTYRDGPLFRETFHTLRESKLSFALSADFHSCVSYIKEHTSKICCDLLHKLYISIQFQLDDREPCARGLITPSAASPDADFLNRC